MGCLPRRLLRHCWRSLCPSANSYYPLPSPPLQLLCLVNYFDPLGALCGVHQQTVINPLPPPSPPLQLLYLGDYFDPVGALRGVQQQTVFRGSHHLRCGKKNLKITPPRESQNTFNFKKVFCLTAFSKNLNQLNLFLLVITLLHWSGGGVNNDALLYYRQRSGGVNNDVLLYCRGVEG